MSWLPVGGGGGGGAFKEGGVLSKSINENNATLDKRYGEKRKRKREKKVGRLHS